MKKFAVALLATTVLGAPGAFAASDNQQPQQSKQMQQNQNGQQRQSGENAQNQSSQQNGQRQAAQNDQMISPDSLSRGEIRQIQQALDKDGFKAGRTDGRWGHETENAVKQFQQSKQRQATGQLDRQTVANLGLDSSQFSQQNQHK
ncbi:peptidoglycan-binding domain-containing protein [Bradyrhizobium sp. USDA 4473]